MNTNTLLEFVIILLVFMVVVTSWLLVLIYGALVRLREDLLKIMQNSEDEEDLISSEIGGPFQFMITTDGKEIIQ